jgi:hypothetical protein
MFDFQYKSLHSPLDKNFSFAMDSFHGRYLNKRDDVFLHRAATDGKLQHEARGDNSVPPH